MNKHLISIALASALASASVSAEIELSGFVSIVGGVTASSDEKLYDYNDNIDFAQGSLFALQASSDLGNGLGVTVQLAAEGANEWDPDFKWAYVSYDASDSLRILAGRQRVPFFMYSDFLDVSYAYGWVAPPKDLYDGAVFDTFDGLGAVYTTNFGDVDATFHGVYGRNLDPLKLDDVVQPAATQFNDLTGLSATLTYDWLTLRAAYFTTDMTINLKAFDDLAAAWQAAGQADISQNIAVEEDQAIFTELGFQVNLDQVIVVGEYINIQLDGTSFADEDAYYVMAGYQFDKFLVHATYGANEETPQDGFTSAVPFGIDPGLDALKGITEGVVASQVSETNYVTVGVRYDFHESAALKVEYTDYSNDLDSTLDAGLFRVALVTVF